MPHSIDALGADRAALLDICAGLDEAAWRSGSGCPGWSVQDVVAHMGALFWAVVDRTRLPDVAGLPTERAQDSYVESRRGLSPAQVLADYAAVSAQALEIMATFDGQDAPVPLGDLGTYPLSVIPTAYNFDHYVHIREDLSAPRGSLEPHQRAGRTAARPRRRMRGRVDRVATGRSPRTIAGPRTEAG